MRYKIHGLGRSDGAAAEVVIDATDEADALKRAAGMGLVVERLVELEAIDYHAAATATAPAAAQVAPRTEACPDCGATVSLQARRCPACGHPFKRAKDVALAGVACIGLGLVTVLVGGIAGGGYQSGLTHAAVLVSMLLWSTGLLLLAASFVTSVFEGMNRAPPRLGLKTAAGCIGGGGVVFWIAQLSGPDSSTTVRLVWLVGAAAMLVGMLVLASSLLDLVGRARR